MAIRLVALLDSVSFNEAVYNWHVSLCNIIQIILEFSVCGVTRLLLLVVCGFPFFHQSGFTVLSRFWICILSRALRRFVAPRRVFHR